MKKILLILTLICMIVFPVFSQTGSLTTNEYFYLPEYGAYGTTEYDEYNTYMEIADNQIKANKDAFDDFKISDITDVDLTDIANLKILKYNSTTEKWKCEDDSGGSGTVTTSGTPVANDIARFTGATVIEGRSYAEFKADLDLEIGTDIQAQDAGLQSIAGLTTSANDMIYTTALDTYAIMDTFAELQAVVADKTLVNVEDGITATAITDDLIVKADFADEDWGDMTVDTNVVTIDADAVTYAKMQNVSATNKVLGRSTAGAGIVEEIACTTAGRALIDDADASTQRTTLGLVIGTNVLAEQTIGIADDNLLEVDDADVADNDYAKFTANGLEGRSYAEVMMDTNPVTTSSANNTLTVAEAGLVLVSDVHTETLPTASGHTGLTYHFVKIDWDYDLITLEGDGAETFNYENSTGSPNLTYLRLNTPLAEVTIVSDGTNWQVISEAMGQVPSVRAYMHADAPKEQEDVTDATAIRLDICEEVYDIGSNFDNGNWVSSSATSTSAGHLVDSTAPFTSAMVRHRVLNTTDTTFTYITAYNSTSDVTVRDDIFADTENYVIYNSKFVVPVAGKYLMTLTVRFGNFEDQDRMSTQILNNETAFAVASLHASGTGALYVLLLAEKAFSAADVIKTAVWLTAGINTIDIVGGESSTNFTIRLISKD